MKALTSGVYRYRLLAGGLAGFGLLLGLSAALARPQNPAPLPAVDFSRDIQPILSNNCYACHGADEPARKAGLRLDTLSGATARRPGGHPPIVPGSAAKSELMRRVTSQADALRMPPPATGKRITPQQAELLRRWIDRGAQYTQHWAFIPPKRPPLPAVKNRNWVRNPIDLFVLAGLEREGLKPSPEADRATLIRRLSLDLIGLPPSPEEVDAFLRDTSPNAYEKVVDRLLASPHYGERWARRWLDIARYADTNGYEKDRERSIWPYRDWVIRALNADMPFDQFTIEQLAGDLLPNPTLDQRIATGFHRNTMQNEEGGIDIAEDRFKSMVDRVNTTGAAWLGLTVGCAQCHNHKYDPISQREYYGLFAYLNNTDEVETDVIKPELKQKREEIQRKIDDLEARRAELFPGGSEALNAKLDRWIKENEPRAVPWRRAKVDRAVSLGNATTTVLPDGSVLASGDKPNTDTYEVTIETDLPQVTAVRLEVLTHPSLPFNGPGRAHFFQPGGFLLSEFEVEAKPKEGGSFKRVPIVDPSADFEAAGRSVSQVLDGKLDTGWAITGQEGRDHRAVFPLAEPVANKGGTAFRIRMDQFFVHQVIIGRFRLSVTGQPLPVKAAPFPADVETALTDALAAGPDTRHRILKEWFLRNAAEMEPVNRQIADLRNQMPAYPTTLVLTARPEDHPRTTYLHKRGEFLKPTDPVPPLTPAVLPLPSTDAPKDRLGLAKWLVSPGNPLTARVTVNREWKAFFGRGLVATLEDFGTRGDLPTHPDLLDWLACEFTNPAADAHAKTQRRKEGQEQLTTETQRHRAVYASLTETSRKAGKGAKKQTQAEARSFPPYQGGTEGGAVPAAVAAASARTPEHLNTEHRPWSLKRLHRLIVTSATYRQSARVTPELAEKDPENRLLARAPRFRVDAEVVRDIALTASGLLDRTIGGPSVFPPQPAEVTSQVYGGGGYTTSTGSNRYRRGLYTHLKRTAPFAAFITFDAPTSETACLRRMRSNTPLQALTTLNDEVYVEAAAALARRVVNESGSTVEARIDRLYRCCLSRSPSAVELRKVRTFYERSRANLQGKEAAAKAIVTTPGAVIPSGGALTDLAAWTLTARAILNLDETINRQ